MSCGLATVSHGPVRADELRVHVGDHGVYGGSFSYPLRHIFLALNMGFAHAAVSNQVMLETGVAWTWGHREFNEPSLFAPGQLESREISGE